MTTEVATTTNAPAVPAAASGIGFDDPEAFKQIQRVAKVFTSSQLVPTTFQGDQNLGNAIIALNMAKRMGADPLAVMQNIYIVHGKPSWSSQFIIACLNSCGRYSPLRFKIEGEGENRTCTAWAIEKGTNERLEGPPVSIGMAKKEGWLGKNGSKWLTMPELMLRYRAATFFGRLYAPELMMGMGTAEEMLEVGPERKETPKPVFVAAEPAEPKPAQVVASYESPKIGVDSPHMGVASLLDAGGVAFDDFRDWLGSTGRHPDPSALGGLDELTEAQCSELLANDAAALRKCITIYGRAAK